MRRVRLIGAATPVNAASELERLAARLEAGQAELPRWDYGRVDVAPIEADLARIAQALALESGPLNDLYSARIEELRVEAAMMACVGTPELGRLAARRFVTTRAANATAARWSAEKDDDHGELVPTDSHDPRSLLSRVRDAIGRARAPFAVRVTTLATLAATGERTVYVARGRFLTERAARRVAHHEVHGHVLPRVRAAGAHPIFELGTARGTDEQEGLALVYEDREGLLDGGRRVELARRHIAARAMREGADFVEVVRMLVAASAEPRAALVAAMRVFRGGDGRFPGLGRESVYITSFLRVRAHLAKRPDDERVLASGQVALAALPALRQFAGRHARPEPPPSIATV